MRFSLLLLPLVAGSLCAQEKWTTVPLIPGGPVPWKEQAMVRSRDFAPASPVEWKVTWNRLQGGKEEGVDLVNIDNGKLRITVIPTRGMGILSVDRSGKKPSAARFGWRSPVE